MEAVLSGTVIMGKLVLILNAHLFSVPSPELRIREKVALLMFLNAHLFSVPDLIIMGKVACLIVLNAHLFSIPSYY